MLLSSSFPSRPQSLVIHRYLFFCFSVILLFCYFVSVLFLFGCSSVITYLHPDPILYLNHELLKQKKIINIQNKTNKIKNINKYKNKKDLRRPKAGLGSADAALAEVVWVTLGGLALDVVEVES